MTGIHEQHQTQALWQRRWLRRTLEVSVFICALALLHLYQTRTLVSGMAPDFEAQLLDGSPVSLRQYRGHPLLLQFWATWCPVCNLEQGSIQSISRDHPVLSVALDGASVAEIIQWMQEKGVDYPVIRDADGVISTGYGVRGVPASLIIDASGQVRFVEVGYTSEWGLRARLWWVGV